VDLSKLSTADKVIAGSAIALFIFMFFPWFSVPGSDVIGGVDFNGYDVGFLWGTFPMLLGLTMLALVAIRAFSPDTDLPELPFSYGQLQMGLGVLAAFLVVLKLLVGEDIAGFDLDRSVGLFLAVVAALGLGAGGFLKMREGEDAAPAGPAAGGDTGF
jgi:hypothetical protein